MYFLALAADYDGTIADHGFVNEATVGALRQLKETGRRLVLVTGRELADVRHAFAGITIFDCVVAENGAVIYDPGTGQERVIAAIAPVRLVEKLMERRVEPISLGRSIVATWEPHQGAVLNVIQELGLELQITFNKGAVMVLPPGVNKASGLTAALAELDIAVHNVVGVGDAENDHAFLHLCGCAAAVANALPAVKEGADIRLSGDHGAGVIELIQKIIRDDARIVPPSRNGLPVGTDRNGSEVYLEPDGRVLIAGESRSGKSRFAKVLTERMVKRQFEFCVVDPEGDYDRLEHAVCIGDASVPPTIEEALRLLRKTGLNLVINKVGLNLSERQRIFESLMSSIAELRARSGRPQWLLIDEAHHVLPAARGGLWLRLVESLPATILITVNPDALASEVIKAVDVILAFGSTATKILSTCAKFMNVPVPTITEAPRQDEILFWSPRSGHPPSLVRIEEPRQIHTRHTGKYAVGDVGERASFYFRGPMNSLNLRAPNLMRFVELAYAVDDATWEHHLRAKDYSSWFRHVIKDEGLAADSDEVARV